MSWRSRACTTLRTPAIPDRRPTPRVAARLRGIVRDFGRVRALDGASLTLEAGSVHGVLGENGAGKSTLLAVLAGLIGPDAGSVEIGGREGWPKSPIEARRRGVGMVYQHFRLVGNMSVLENLALASAPSPFSLPFADVRRRVAGLLAETGWKLPLGAKAGELGVGDRQRVEIVKALLTRPAILVLDEPTAVLAPPEIGPFFELIRELRSKGMAVALVAHKLGEAMAVADRFTVLRRGRTILDAEPREAVSLETLGEAMVGTEPPAPSMVPSRAGLRDQAPSTPSYPSGYGKIVCRLHRASVRGPAGEAALDELSLSLRRGEIVGVVGVEGNGQGDLVRLVSGRVQPDGGHVDLPERVGFIPPDRTSEGIAGELDLTENVALAAREAGFWIGWRNLRKKTRSLIRAFDLKTESLGTPGRALSGGNQQRLLVARELGGRLDLLVAANPTRGLDFRATRFVHDTMLGLLNRSEPPGILLVTTDLDEAVKLAHRAFAIVRGRLIPAPAGSARREMLGRLMVGG